MTTIGIHQPHYFPWMGYFDKMAKSDFFILLDDVQLEKGSYMYRNRILDTRGSIVYMTIPGNKHGFLDKKYREITSSNETNFLTKHAEMIKSAYKDSSFFDEIWSCTSDLFEVEEETICEYCIRSIVRIKKILGIETELIKQSELNYDKTSKKNDLVVNLCRTMKASDYISGNGARKYTDESSFAQNGINLHYQTFLQPEYNQLHSQKFVNGLSILDMLFNCGITLTRDLFWSTVEKGTEFSN